MKEVSGVLRSNPLRGTPAPVSHPHEAVSPPTSSPPGALIAQAWLDAFNAGDVPKLVDLYAEECTHTSPKIRALHPETGGKLVGRPALREWWVDALKRLPGLRYEKTAMTASDERVVLEYVRHAPDGPPMPIAEVFDVRAGKIVASRVYHG